MDVVEKFGRHSTSPYLSVDVLRDEGVFVYAELVEKGDEVSELSDVAIDLVVGNLFFHRSLSRSKGMEISKWLGEQSSAS